MEMRSIEKELQNNSYPGRGLLSVSHQMENMQ